MPWCCSKQAVPVCQARVAGHVHPAAITSVLTLRPTCKHGDLKQRDHGAMGSASTWIQWTHGMVLPILGASVTLA